MFFLTPVTRCPSDSKILYTGGIFDKYSNPISEALLKRGGELIQASGVAPNQSDFTNPIHGTYFYGGIILLHYGHFITETLSRISLFANDKYNGIVFHSPDGISSFCQLPKWAIEIFSIFGVGQNNIVFVNMSLTFSSLECPPAQFEINGESKSQHYTFLSSRLAQHLSNVGVSGEPIEKLYVSRSRFSKGIVAGEHIFEELLRSNGFTIIYPELLTFSHQVSYLRSAKVCLGIAGSALHSYLFVNTLPRKLVTIERRGNKNSAQYAISKLVGLSQTCINAILSESQSDSKAITLIDYRSLCARLTDDGLIDNTFNAVEDSAIAEEYQLLCKYERIRSRANSLKSKYLNQGTFADLEILDLESLDALRPTLPGLKHILSLVYYSKCRYDEASFASLASIELSPGEPRYLRQAAQCYKRLGNTLKSLDHIEQAIQLSPFNKEYAHFKSLLMEKNSTKKGGGSDDLRNVMLEPCLNPQFSFNDKLLYLHIGLHKTGSTAFQRYLVANKALLEKQGVSIPRHRGDLNVNAYHHNLAWQIIGDRRCQLPTSAFKDFVEQLISDPLPRHVVSSEDFCLASVSQIERLSRDFKSFAAGSLRVVPVVVLRNPLSLALSMYEGRLGGNQIGFSEFLSKRMCSDFRLQPNFVIGKWKHSFPEVKVVLYEDIRDDLCKKLCDTLVGVSTMPSMPVRVNAAKNPLYHKISALLEGFLAHQRSSGQLSEVISPLAQAVYLRDLRDALCRPGSIASNRECGSQLRYIYQSQYELADQAARTFLASVGRDSGVYSSDPFLNFPDSIQVLDNDCCIPEDVHDNKVDSEDLMAAFVDVFAHFGIVLDDILAGRLPMSSLEISRQRGRVDAQKYLT
jgi:tetratricopeptide (TPR) repeat protein